MSNRESKYLQTVHINLYTSEMLFIITGRQASHNIIITDESRKQKEKSYLVSKYAIYRILHTWYIHVNVKKIHMIWMSLLRRFQERNIAGVYFKTFRNMAERISISRQVEWQIGIAKRLSTFPSAFRVFTQTGIHIHQSLGVIEIGGNRSWCFPRLGHDGAQRKFYYGAPLSTSLDTTLFIIRGY